jgi:nickel/cobalt exporter
MGANLFFYLTATVLGGLHALEPGHGKTVVAAYLMGTKGRKIDAVILGLVVTVTHTFSVILLGIAAKVASTRINLTEQSLHGYLGLVAGLLILVVGTWMLVSKIRGKEPFNFHSHNHDHSHHHHHHHDDPAHSHGNDHGHSHDDVHHHGNAHSSLHKQGSDHGHHAGNASTTEGKRIGLWQLLLLGVSGGLVPCPAAIAVLLAAVGAGRLGQGLTYILLFSLGLATVLIAVGLMVVGAGKVAARFLDAQKLARKVSIASAAIITLIGVVTIVASVQHLT